MAPRSRGIVVFGDVLDSRADPVAASDWLRQLSAELDDGCAAARLARFGFTQGDEIQGLLAWDADPFVVPVRGALGEGSRPMRWAIAAGAVDPGSGPATERTGAAFLAARDALGRARTRREGLVVVSGDPATDEILAGLGPVLAALLDDLTERQRQIGRLMLVDGLRQSEVAERLGISRPTVSVAVGRARIREIGRLAAAARTLLGRGQAAALAAGAGVGAGPAVDAAAASGGAP